MFFLLQMGSIQIFADYFNVGIEHVHYSLTQCSYFWYVIWIIRTCKYIFVYILMHLPVLNGKNIRMPLDSVIRRS